MGLGFIPIWGPTYVCRVPMMSKMEFVCPTVVGRWFSDFLFSTTTSFFLYIISLLVRVDSKPKTSTIKLLRSPPH